MTYTEDQIKKYQEITHNYKSTTKEEVNLKA